MDSQITKDDDGSQENVMSQGDGSNGDVTAADIISRAEFEVSICNDRLFNLHMLLVEVANRERDIEALMLDPDTLSTERLEKAFEFGTLYGILDSEISELEKLVSSIQTDVGNVEKKLANVEESEGRLKHRLRAATQSLMDMKARISTLRRESAYFDRVIDPSHHKAGMLHSILGPIDVTVDCIHFLTI
jgi:chromosome segregation ATPase